MALMAVKNCCEIFPRSETRNWSTNHHMLFRVLFSLKLKFEVLELKRDVQLPPVCAVGEEVY